MSYKYYPYCTENYFEQEMQEIVPRDEYVFEVPKKSKQYFWNALMVFTVFSCLFVKNIEIEVY